MLGTLQRLVTLRKDFFMDLKWFTSAKMTLGHLSPKNRNILSENSTVFTMEEIYRKVRFT
jgi:hypothetical protein